MFSYVYRSVYFPDKLISLTFTWILPSFQFQSRLQQFLMHSGEGKENQAKEENEPEDVLSS